MARLKAFRPGSIAGARDVRQGVSDTRGTVSLELLIAFFPVFLIFLATCQLALIASARLLVEHAAFLGARSAIVVLEDRPEAYDGAPRGSLTVGDSDPAREIAAWFRALDRPVSAPSSPGTAAQTGARMVPIRNAAWRSLLPLAPKPSSVVRSREQTLERSLSGSWADEMDFALRYVAEATEVSVHEGADERPAVEITEGALVRVKVRFFYPCSVPLVAAMLCERRAILGRMRRGVALEAEVGLPLQSAGYERSGGEA